MRSIISTTSRILFFSLCILCIPQAAKPLQANEAVLEAIQKQMAFMTQAMDELKTTVQNQNEIIRDQNIRIQTLEQVGPTTVAIPQPDKAPKLAGLSQGFNPDIGVVGTVQAQLTEDKEDAEGKDTIALKELELSLSQYVDPYSRMDAIIAFNDNLEEQNVDIEEAYYTHWGLPLGFVGTIGKFRSKIGKQNVLHLHQLETVDYPLVIQNFFGEEGLSSSGARIQNYIPNPWDIPIEISGEILRGNNGESFSGISRRPIFNTHIKTFFEPTDTTALELGATAMFGDQNPPVDDGTGTGTFITLPEGQDRYSVHVFGGDATFLWYLPEGRQVKFQNEVYFQDRNDMSINEDPWGFYSLLDFRLSKRFSTGVRFDFVQPLDINGDHHQTTGISPYLTLHQSEFANFRLQFSHTDPADAEAESDDAVYLQANFMIGAHKHPVQ